MAQTYVPLHVHSTYSLLDGLSLPNKLAKRAKALELPAIALTDHGNLGGTMDMFSECQKVGIKFIPGCEVYFTQDIGEVKTREMFHLNLFAQDTVGWKNLMKIVSTANTDHFYYKPRATWALLEQYNQGLMATSACIGSVAGMAIMKGDEKKAWDYIARMKDLLGDRWFVEVTDTDYPDQKTVNPVLIKIANDLGIKIVATNDLHYVDPSDAKIHDALLCVQTASYLGDPKRPFKFETPEFYLKSTEEMLKLWPAEYLQNTIEFAERSNVDLSPKGYDLPKFPTPDNSTPDDYLKELCFEGWARKIEPKFAGTPIYETYQIRARYELEVIKKIGVASYFLIVHDYVHAALKAGIRVGPGRGSAAGSLVLFLLGITKIDSIKHGLLFERFMNPDRVSMPDVDIDFEDKDWVIQYLLRRWGQENCAPICTYGRIWARNAVRDSVRVLNLGESVATEITKVIPDMHNEDQAAKPASFAELFPASVELRKMKEKYPAVFELAEGFEGAVRSSGIHASGVVIAPSGLLDKVPLMVVTDKEAKEKSKKTIATQFDGYWCDKIGLLKVDILGLKTLRLMSIALKAIKKNHGIDIDPDEDIPDDDDLAFTLLRNSESLGIFQLEGVGMQNLLKQVGVDSVNDIIATIALFRPGPISAGLTYSYARRKHGEQYQLLHPRMADALKETYGVVTYQEQMMKISVDVAGWTYAQSDMLRKACGKMDPKLMREQKEKFIPSCLAQGVSQEVAEEIFKQFEGFGVYAFNKSHSAAYGMLAYQCAYLKAHYPREFMSALLTNEGDPAKSLLYLNECKRLGTINLTPPDINESDLAFNPSLTALRYGLGGVKNVGEKAITAILEKRPYSSFTDFIWKHITTTQVNRRVIECLIKVGCFNSMGYNGFKLLKHLDEIRDGIKYVNDVMIAKRKAKRGDAEAPSFPTDEWEKKLKEFDEVWSMDETLAFEKDLLEVYLSGHPLDKYAGSLAEKGITTSSMIDEDFQGPIKVAGVIASVQEITTKKKEPMAFVRIEDTYSTLQIILWPSSFLKYRALCEKGKIVVIKGFYRDKQVTLGDSDIMADLTKLP